MEQTRNNEKIIRIVLSFLTAFTFFFFAPFNIYLSNISDFWFSPSILLPLISGVAIIVFIIIAIALKLMELISHPLYRVTCTFTVIIDSALFIQGNFIVDKNGVLDGNAIDWSVINSSMIWSMVLWIIAISALVFVTVKKKHEVLQKHTFGIAGIIFAIEVASLGVLLLMKHDFSDKDYYEVTTQGEFELSNKNFIVFVLDTFDARYFRDYADEEVREILRDFTFFPDTLSVYGHTDLSLPQMLTGIEYYNDEPYGDYLKHAYEKSNLLNYLIDNRWNIGLYTDSIIPAGRVADKTVNCQSLDVQVSSKKRFLRYIYQLVAYNYSPYYFKKYFWFYPSQINDTREIADEELLSYDWKNEVFYHDMNISVSDNDKKTFRLYHLKGMHGPNDHDRYLQPVTELVSDEELFWGNMLLIDNYLKELRKNGIFDNSAIIIMADHGNTKDENGRWNQNPILLIKGYNETHEFDVDETKVSYENLQNIYLNLLAGSTAYNSVTPIEKTSSRRFLRYEYDNEKKAEESYFPPIREYLTESDAEDFNAMRFTGTVYDIKR